MTYGVAEATRLQDQDLIRGSLVGTNLARELFPDSADTLSSRLAFALAVQRSAARLGDEVFRTVLSGATDGEGLFTTGGMGLVNEYSSRNGFNVPLRDF